MTAIAATRRSMKELVDGTIRVQLDIDPAFRDDFLRLFSKIDMPVAIVQLTPDFERQIPDEKAEPEPASTGHWVSALYKSGWFFNPKVLAALGTDDEYRAWIQRQPSCVSGEFEEFVNGEGRSVAAHVRRAGESGTAYKPPYACVPLSDAEHQKQHTQGESAFHGGAEFFDKQRAKYVQAWGHVQLRAALGVESLTEATAPDLVVWAQEKEIYNTLPLAVKNPTLGKE